MKITLDSIISGFKSVTKLIANFDAIESELNNKVLYRDNPSGEPNQMENDLDMNNNRITNLPTATNNTEPVTYAQWLSGSAAVQFTGTLVDARLGSDAAGSTFTVSEYTPGSNNLQVYLNGVLQPVSTYTEPTATTVVMRTAPVSDDEYTFIINSRQVDTDLVPASSVTYTPVGGAATNADAHLKTIDTKLQETVSVKDFGAVGDGVTDDTAAIQAALDTGSNVDFGDYSNTYKVTVSGGAGTQAIATSANGQKLIGTATLKRAPSSLGYILRVSHDNTVIQGLSFDGNRGNVLDDAIAQHSIRSYNTDKCEISGCKFINNPATCLDLDTVNDWKIHSNTFTGGFRSHLVIGVTGDTTSDKSGHNLIYNNFFDGTDDGQVANGIFISADSDSAGGKVNAEIIYTIITGNTFKDIGDAAIESGYKSKYTAIVGNTILDSYNVGILIRDNFKSLVSSNTVNAKAGGAGNNFGIFIDGDQLAALPITECYISITGNTVYDATECLTIIDASHCTVTGNVLQGSSTSSTTGVSIKAPYTTLTGNDISRVQFGIRFADSRLLSEHSNCLISCNNVSNVVDFTSIDNTSLIKSALLNNMISNVSGKLCRVSGSNVTNVRWSGNIDTDNVFKTIEDGTDQFLISDNGFERSAPVNQFDSTTLQLNSLSGLITVRSDSGEAAVFLITPTAISSIQESTSIGDSASGKDYRVEISGTSIIIKRFSVSQSISTFYIER